MIKFKTGSLAAYKALGTPDGDTLYFINDTLQLFKGSELYGKSFRVVDGIPAAGIEDVLYIDRLNKKIQTYKDGVWTDALDANIVIEDEVKADGVDAVSGKAVASYVQSAIDNVTGGATATVISGIAKGDTFGTIKVTQGSNVTPVEVNLAGVVADPTYDSETRVITLPQYGKDALVINLGKDMVVKSGSYDADNKNLELVLTDGSKVTIPVGDLVDIYEASDDTTGAVQISISNNKIKGSVIADGTTIKVVEGKLTADFSTLVTLEAFNALKGRVDTAEQDIITLKGNVSTINGEISSIKTTYLTKDDAASTYATAANLATTKTSLEEQIADVTTAWQAAISWTTI